MNEPLPLTECDQEPIHIPGAVQPHGALLAVDPASWRVTHASANIGGFLGADGAAAPGRPLAELFGEEVASLLRHDVQARRANPGGTALDAGVAGGRIRLLAHISRSGAICIDLLPETPWGSAEPALTQAQRVIQSLRLSRTSVGLSSIAMNEIRRITGYDRVMVYRFDEDGSGEVIAEDRAVTVGRTLTPDAFRTILAALTALASDDVAATASLATVTGDASAPLDDFGVGYSSLSTLQRLPADIVKLDRSFVPAPDATMTPDGLSFLAAIVTLAHTAGLTVVIEGVETQAQLDAVVLAGVDAIQGFFLARPMSGEAAVAAACQLPGERGRQSQLDTARRFAAGARLVVT